MTRFNRNIIFILTLLLSPLIPVFSQQYNFRNFSVEDGLAQSQVYAICEDIKGNIWFGTRGGGISRFDGINFTNFTTQDGLVYNYIKAIIKDHKGHLWIATDKGLSQYDGMKFFNYSSKQGLYNESVNAVLEDRKGTIWIGTEDGIFHLVKDTIVRFGRKLNAPREKINCLFEDHYGTMWAGTDFGIYKFKQGNDTYSMESLSVKEGLAGNQITSIKEDTDHRIVVCTYSGGISVLEKGTIRNLTKAQGLPGNTVYDCVKGSDGTLWFGTSNGISHIDLKENDKVIQNITEAEGLANNVVMSLYMDSFGNIWFGTSGGGISRLGSERFIHYKAIKGVFGNWVYSICEDRYGNKWFGTSEGGVTRYDGRVFKRFSERDGFTASKVKYIYQDIYDNLWFGTIADGVYLYNGKSFRNFSKKNGLNSNFINYITGDSSGTIWLATAGGGIDYLIPNKKSFRIKHITKRSGLLSDRINTLLKDKRGVLWAGTAESGISRISIDSLLVPVVTNYTLAEGMIGNGVRCSSMDSNGKLYFGTSDAGVLIFNGKVFSEIGKSKGLASNNVYSLIFDNDGNLWIGTEKGIDRVSLDNKLKISDIRHFGKAEGFLGIETIQNSVCKDKEGNIWFGSIKSATVFNALKERPVKLPLVYIKGINLFYNDIKNTPYVNASTGWYSIPKELKLPYDQNHLTFEFIGIEQSNPESVQYRWKLSGFDEQWSPVSQKREAVYSNLAPGLYTFEVTACNELGEWTKSPAKFTFIIKPPFWKTWWFTLIILIALFIIIWITVKYALRRIREDNERERLKLEMDRNLLELEQKALRMQMNPHFLFNCLNSIKGLIAEGKDNEAKIYLSKFAKLMRGMLDSSMDTFISLEIEIASLHNYVELEKLSREDKFTFCIETNENVNPEFIQVPPMLIQPFVENAIIHGLIAKQSQGKLTVYFVIENNHLKCIIEDNGIGREQASILKEESVTKHKSAAIAVTQDRLNILNKKLSLPELKILITDLKDMTGEPSGTRVELFIPYQQV